MLKIDYMFTHYASVSERLLVFIDNNVLEDILKRDDDSKHKHKHKHKQRFHSLLAALCLAQDYYMLDIFACVSPAILFEAGGKKTSCSVRQAQALISKVEDAIADVGLATHFVGFNHPRQLMSIFKKISRDELRIRRAWDKALNDSWKRDFSISRIGGTKIPFSLAEEECPNIRLNYFRPWYVKAIFMHRIEKLMYEQNKQERKARQLMFNVKSAFSIIKRKQNGIAGIGDIELLSYCDLTSQTMRNKPVITMGITYDKALYETLWARSEITTQGPAFQGGEDNVSDFSLCFLASAKQSEKRTSKANRRMREYAEAGKIFANEVLGAALRETTTRQPAATGNPESAPPPEC